MAACSFYNLCFFTYIWLMPVFLQFLIRAPSNLDRAPFDPVPLRTLSGDVPGLYMSSFPQTTRRGVNHCRPCMEMGSRSGMYQWDIMLSMSETDLIKESRDKPVSTMYPLVFASNDAKVWKVVADADDVAGKGHWAGKDQDADEATHLSAPLLVAKLKNFGCIDEENSDTDPFFKHFATADKAKQFKWRLVKHVGMHGSVNLVACVLQGMEAMNQKIHTYARDCMYEGEMKCHLTTRDALSDCFAIGSACGQACNFFAQPSAECQTGTLNEKLFQGLTHRRVKIKSVSGGGAAKSLQYCSKSPCKSGLHFNEMYVEAANPIEFLKAQVDIKNKEKGSYYVMIFAISDYHPAMHTFEVPQEDEDDSEDEDETDEESGDGSDDSEDKKEDEDTGHHAHHETEDHEKPAHHDKDDHKKPAHHDKKEHDGKDDKKGTPKKPVHHKPPPKKKPHKRTCVDLPGVRLDEVDKTGLKAAVGTKGHLTSPLACTAACGRNPACQQSVFSAANKGCYLFKLPTVQVKEFSAVYNSSYCGDAKDKELMMTMLHQAYKKYVPPSPADLAPPPVRLLSEAEEELPRKLQGLSLDDSMDDLSLSDSEDTGEIGPNKKYFWQIAHVPNGTKGVIIDQGANEVRVIPRNTSCFTTAGFVYMVACMTAKPVYVSDRTHPLKPPPFNDRCLAVGGLCGATCGSGQQVSEKVAQYCPVGNTARRLSGNSPYVSAPIPKEMLVQPIDPETNSNTKSYAARCFFNIFVFIAVVSYVSTILSKFPGTFHDVYPIHTWDEIRTHGYVLDKFGSAVTCSTSALDNKMIVIRNWVGKMTTRPQFDDTAFPTFAKWVDVFCDEGHREGARILWMAWCEFLDTSPPMQFLEDWAKAIRDISPGQANTCSPFDLKWGDGKGKKVLPVVPSQAQAFGEDAPEGGVTLQQDSLARLRDLCEVYCSLPNNLVLESSLPRTDDVVLTRRVAMDLQVGGNQSFTIPHCSDWQSKADKKADERARQLGVTKEKYNKSVTVTDAFGTKIKVSSSTKLTEQQFPLHYREPVARTDRQVIMVYAARAKPEVERKGIEKTRGLDPYLWASLRPKAVRKSGGNSRKNFDKKAKQPEDQRPLLDDVSERSWSSVGNGNVQVFEEVKKSVEGAVERQHACFLDIDPDEEEAAAKRAPGPRDAATLQRDLTKSYLKHRTVDSDWEMARFCHGEVVGEELDVDGNEVVILDNPSPALLEIVSDPPAGIAGNSGRPSMGLVALEDGDAVSQGCFGTAKTRAAHATKPSLQFRFCSTKPDTPETANFQKELRRKLQRELADPTADVSALKIHEKRKGNELFVDITGPGKTIELIRACNIRDLEVMNFHGRMMDTHPAILVKKELLMPYAGVRGRSGGLNFVVDLLQFREGFIGSAAEGDTYPERMLLGVFDAVHQPHPDFWKRCLPKFVNNTENAYTYKVNDEIALVQAPEFAGKGDSDSLTGVSFEVLNMIRNRCGGVTSCGTNAVWQVNAKELNRQDDDAATEEYFHSKTLIDDTATTHGSFCNGKRSVYVQEKVATGLSKSTSACLTAIQMRTEGAVQLFFVELFSEKIRQLIFFSLCVLLFIGMICYQLYGPSSKELMGFSFFCDAEADSLLLGTNHPMCTSVTHFFGYVIGRTDDKTSFEMAEPKYMQLLDMAFCWLLVCIIMAVVTAVLAFRKVMPSIVRVFIMMENISYWLTSWNTFYWLALTLFMVIGMDPPLSFNPNHFMFLALLVNITQHCMLDEYKSNDVSQISIWRSQQSHTLAAPLYVSAIAQGTIAAWHIIWGQRDKSYWNSATTEEVVTNVTVWVTFIWVAFACTLIAIVGVNIFELVTGQTPDALQNERHFRAFYLIGLLAITVLEPFLSLWGTDQTIEATSKKSENICKRTFAKLLVWWRTKAWLLRYFIDFCIPILVMCGIVKSGHHLITLVAYAATVHGLRV